MTGIVTIKPLYEITNEYIDLLNEITEADELTEEHFQKLDLFKGEIQEKIVNVSAYIKNLESRADSIDDAIHSMLDRSKKTRNKAERIKEYLKNNMEKLNIQEITCPYFDIKIKNNPCSVDILNKEEIPSEFIKETILLSIDKKAIAKHIKNGSEVPGAQLIRKRKIEIK